MKSNADGRLGFEVSLNGQGFHKLERPMNLEKMEIVSFKPYMGYVKSLSYCRRTNCARKSRYSDAFF